MCYLFHAYTHQSTNTPLLQRNNKPVFGSSQCAKQREIVGLSGQQTFGDATRAAQCSAIVELGVAGVVGTGARAVAAARGLLFTGSCAALLLQGAG